MSVVQAVLFGGIAVLGIAAGLVDEWGLMVFLLAIPAIKLGYMGRARVIRRRVGS